MAIDVILAHRDSPFVTAWGWSSGFGSKYSNPGTLPTGNGQGIAYTSGAVAVAHSASPYTSAYAYTVGTGWGSKATDAGTPPQDNGFGVSFSPTGADLVVSYQNVFKRISAWPWTGAWGTIYTDPSTALSGNPNGPDAVACSPDGAYAGSAHITTPFVSVYAFAHGSGLGTKVSDPGTLPADTGNALRWSPDGAYVAVAHATSPFQSVYPWSGGAFGSKVSNPATLPGGNGRSTIWSADGSTIFNGQNGASPWVAAWPWSGGAFGSKYSDPGTTPTGASHSVASMADSSTIAVGHNTSPFISVYPFSAGWGTKYSNPGTLAPNSGAGVTFAQTAPAASVKPWWPYFSQQVAQMAGGQ